MSKELNEKKNDLITRAEEIVNAAKTETRELTEDELKEIEEIKETVDRIAKTLKVEEDVKGMEKKQDDTPTEPTAEEKKEDAVQEKRDIETNEAKAFENYIRGYVINERAGELTKTDNGAVIPTTIANQIIKKVYDVSPVLEKSQRYNVKGKIDLPYYDTAESSIKVTYADEFQSLTSSNGKFKSISLGGFLAGALSKVSMSLINNAQFDIVSFVVSEMAESIARFIEKELLIGTSNKVEGLSTLKNKVTAAAADVITADEVIKLHDAIKDAYQNGAIWIMSNATRTALRLLKGQDGHYLLQNDINAPFGTTLLGKPVYVSDNMPEIGSNNTAIYYGDMSGLAVKFSEDVNVQVLRERYADEHAVGVIGWFEFDSKVQDEQKIAKLVCGA